MILFLSIVFSFLLAITSYILSYIINKNILISLIIGIFAFLLVIALFCGAIILILIFKGKQFAKTYDPRDKKRWRLMNDVSSFIIFWLGIKIHVKGMDKLPKKQPLVFYSNHQGFLDMFVYDLVLKSYPRGSMYKIEHTKNPIISGMVKALGGVPIDRSDDRSAVKSVLTIINEVKNGVNFMIYPEGTRSRGITLNDYHAGSFKIAQKSGAPLVVLAIDGAYKKSCAIPFFRTNIYVEIVDVYENEKICSMPTVELSKLVFEQTKKALEIARNNKKKED